VCSAPWPFCCSFSFFTGHETSNPYCPHLYTRSCGRPTWTTCLWRTRHQTCIYIYISFEDQCAWCSSMRIMAVVHAKIKARWKKNQNKATEWRILLWKSPENTTRNTKRSLPGWIGWMFPTWNQQPLLPTPLHMERWQTHMDRPSLKDSSPVMHFLFIFLFLEEQCDVTCTVLQKAALLFGGMCVVDSMCLWYERTVSWMWMWLLLTSVWLAERTQTTSSQQRANQQHYTDFSRKCADSNWLWLWGMIKIK